jgi:hypothetical protein
MSCEMIVGNSEAPVHVLFSELVKALHIDHVYLKLNVYLTRLSPTFSRLRVESPRVSTRSSFCLL